MGNLHDMSWMILCGVLVMFMQAGFACLESGFVRAKNSINVAIKNLVDFCVAAIIFWAVGFGMMFGATAAGWIGISGFFAELTGDPWNAAFFFFQLVFCGTATTIVSGAVAERISFKGYLLVAIVTSMAIYPVAGHWGWNGAAEHEAHGWLNSLGFVDFAGSTVVHSVGGWVSLAAILILGPRLGRFDGKGNEIQGHNLVLATVGLIFLWFGWYGFNAGSTLGLTVAIPVIVINTTLAGAAGALTGLALAWWRKGRPDVPQTINGALAGLIAITASVHAVLPGTALVIGAMGGAVMVGLTCLLERLHVDDAVGAVPAHAGAGVWGTLAVGIYGDPILLGTGLGWWEQIGIQVAGIGACALWSFGASFGLLWTINRFVPLRVSNEAEQEGLNKAEHQAMTASVELLRAMDHQRATGNFTSHFPVEPHTEVGEIAHEYNQVLDKVIFEQTEREAALRSLMESKVQLEETAHELEIRNAELTEARDQALQAARAKSEFLATMSHEIRTPLNGILGMAELLRRTPLSYKQQRLAEMVHHSGSLLLQIINDILDFAKIEAGRLELERVPFDLRRVIEDIFELFTEQARAKGLELKQYVAADVPLLVNGDPTRLAQILMNLVSNAIKFTHQGEVAVDMMVAESCEQNVRLRCEVRDTGIGIPASAQEKIFESFAQADGSMTRKYGGTGLGLAIAKQLVQAMDGQIGVQNHEGEGTTFWFTASLSVAQRSQVTEQTVSRVKAIAPDSILSGADVLLAEDNLVSRDVAIGFLESAGCCVDAVTDGVQAVEACRRKAYHLVFMDCQMPGLDGYTACGQIRELQDRLGRRTPIVALTANGLKSDREHCLAVGMDDYLSKPYTQEQLIAIARRWVSPETAPALPHGETIHKARSVASSSGSATCLDERTLQALLALSRPSRPDVCAAVLAKYLDSSSGYIEAVRQAIAEQNSTALFHAAHAMKSSSGMVGALALAEKIKELESLGRSGDLVSAPDLFAQVEMEYHRVREAIKELLAKKAA
jgi:Amt family ammonium transporter